ncbi:hypothetical protein EMIT0180MI3_30394 [Priestia megaterium]
MEMKIRKKKGSVIQILFYLRSHLIQQVSAAKYAEAYALIAREGYLIVPLILRLYPVKFAVVSYTTTSFCI